MNDYPATARAASASHCLSHKKDVSYKPVLPCPVLIRTVLFINIALLKNFVFEIKPFTMSLIMRSHHLFSWSVALELLMKFKKFQGSVWKHANRSLDSSARAGRLGSQAANELYTNMVSLHKHWKNGILWTNQPTRTDTLPLNHKWPLETACRWFRNYLHHQGPPSQKSLLYCHCAGSFATSEKICAFTNSSISS